MRHSVVDGDAACLTASVYETPLELIRVGAAALTTLDQDWDEESDLESSRRPRRWPERSIVSREIVHALIDADYLFAGVVPELGRQPLLSYSELFVLDLLGRAMSEFEANIAGRERRTRDGDVAEFADKIHQLQRTIMAQAAARAYPQLLRLAGGIVPAVR
jgi:hypothetical protein